MIEQGNISPELLNESMNKAKKRLIEEAKANKDEIVNSMIENHATIKTILIADNLGLATETILYDVLEKIMGYDVSKMLPKNNWDTFDVPWEFLIKTEPIINGKIEFEKAPNENGLDYSFVIIMDGVEVYPNKGVKSDENQTTTTTTTLGTTTSSTTQTTNNNNNNIEDK